MFRAPTSWEKARQALLCFAVTLSLSFWEHTNWRKENKGERLKPCCYCLRTHTLSLDPPSPCLPKHTHTHLNLGPDKAYPASHAYTAVAPTGPPDTLTFPPASGSGSKHDTDTHATPPVGMPHSPVRSAPRGVGGVGGVTEPRFQRDGAGCVGGVRGEGGAGRKRR